MDEIKHGPHGAAEYHRGRACPLGSRPTFDAGIGGSVDEIKHGPHGAAEYHHHHTHAADSQHVGSHHLLTVEHLTVSYRMYDPRSRFWLPRRVHHNVLRDLTLSVHEGEILALVGASGSGKSVLADALMGLFDANAVASGEMWFDGSGRRPYGPI